MWTTIYHTGVVTDNTFSSSSIFSCSLQIRALLLMSGSVLDCIFELQHLFNHTLVSKEIYMLIKETSPLITLCCCNVSHTKKYEYTVLQIIWTEETCTCIALNATFYFVGHPFSIPFRIWKPQWLELLYCAVSGMSDMTARRNQLFFCLCLQLLLDRKQWGCVSWVQDLSWYPQSAVDLKLAEWKNRQKLPASVCKRLCKHIYCDPCIKIHSSLIG